MKQTWKAQPSDRRTGRHLARFILVGLYMGTRSGAIRGAAMRPTPGHGFIDLERGVFYRGHLARKSLRSASRQSAVRRVCWYICAAGP